MKKLLSIAGAIILCTTTSANIIACQKNQSPQPSPIVDLKTVIISTTLGPIITNHKNKPNEQEIKDAIKNKNPNININGILISNINPLSAVITGDNKIYTGKLTVIYKVIDQILKLLALDIF